MNRVTQLTVVLCASACQLLGDIGDRELASREAGSAGAETGGLGGNIGGSAGTSGSDASLGGGSGGAGVNGHVQSKLFGNDRISLLTDLAVDRTTNELVITGHFEEVLAFGNGTAPLQGDIIGGDFYVARLDSDFVAIWARVVNGVAVQQALVAEAPNRGTVFGITPTGSMTLGPGFVFSDSSSDADILVALYTSDGGVEWAKRFGGDQIQALHGLDMSEQGIALIGTTAEPLDFGGTTQPLPPSAFLVVLDASGNAIWARGFPGCPELQLLGVAWAPDGDLAITGKVQGSCDLGDGIVLPSEAGDVARCFAARIEAQVLTWAVEGGEEHCLGADVAFGPDSQMAIAGQFYGLFPRISKSQSLGADAYAVAWDVNGQKLWTYTQLLPGTDTLSSLDFDPNGDAVVSGVFESGFLAAKISGSDGSTTWSASFPPIYAFAADSRVAFDGSGAIIVAGTLAKPIDFGGGVLDPGVESDDLFLVKYAP
jgi:hypothetical protein